MSVVVKPILFLLICVFAIPGLDAFVEWDSLRATWCPGNSQNDHCFQDIPLTVESALKSGWRKIKGSTCRNGGKFYGHRMARNDDYGITPLFDKNGIIAGVQVNALKSELFATSNPYNFDDVPDYLDNSIERQPILSLTTYFVNPKTICRRGRSERILEIEGTGSRLYFQTGNSPEHLRPVPLYRDAAEKAAYTSTNCVATMGHHNYYDVPNMHFTNCTTMIPSFLLFNNNGELHGFGQTTIGSLSSASFEHPNGFAVKTGLDPITPQCMIDMADSPSSPGYSNIHFYLVAAPRDIRCSPINQTEVTGDSVFISPNAYKKQFNSIESNVNVNRIFM